MADQNKKPAPRLRGQRRSLMPSKPKGCLIVIGGHEDRKNDKEILKYVAQRIGVGPLVIATLASEKNADLLFSDYERVFRGAGVRHLRHLRLTKRKHGEAPAKLDHLENARGVFFSGGDQMKITSLLGGTPVCDQIHDLYFNGGMIAGTSAGASMMSEVMLVSDSGEETHRLGGTLKLAPGLGFLSSIIIDQHFAERGRIGRLLGAVAQNPKYLGVGIDEDTAIIVEREKTFKVMGSGAVYVIDGQNVTQSNISEKDPDKTLSIFNVTLHVLSRDDVYDIYNRCPKD